MNGIFEGSNEKNFMKSNTFMIGLRFVITNQCNTISLFLPFVCLYQCWIKMFTMLQNKHQTESEWCLSNFQIKYYRMRSKELSSSCGTLLWLVSRLHPIILRLELRQRLFRNKIKANYISYKTTMALKNAWSGNIQKLPQSPEQK